MSAPRSTGRPRGPYWLTELPSPDEKMSEKKCHVLRDTPSEELRFLIKNIARKYL
jgi:hypothetical protein